MLCCPHTSTRSHPLEHGQPTRTTSLKETDSSSPRSPRQFKAHQASSWPHECPPHLLMLTNLILCMFCSGSCSCCEITSQKSCHVQKMLLDSSSLSLTMFLTPFCDAPWALGEGYVISMSHLWLSVLLPATSPSTLHIRGLQWRDPQWSTWWITVSCWKTCSRWWAPSSQLWIFRQASDTALFAASTYSQSELGSSPHPASLYHHTWACFVCFSVFASNSVTDKKNSSILSQTVLISQLNYRITLLKQGNQRALKMFDWTQGSAGKTWICWPHGAQYICFLAI